MDEILWGDKTPAYMAELPLLGSLYPGARFVHLVRDRATACLDAGGMGNTPLRTAQEWADRVCRRAPRARRSARRGITSCAYEDLVGDVRGRLAATFDFLGVLTPADAGEFLRVPRTSAPRAAASRVMTGERQKWKQRMSPWMRRRIEEVAGDLLDAYGYDAGSPTSCRAGCPPRR